MNKQPKVDRQLPLPLQIASQFHAYSFRCFKGFIVEATGNVPVYATANSGFRALRRFGVTVRNKEKPK
jgi:hypothetical protein